MAENTASISPSADANETEIADNWVNIVAKPPNQTASSSKNVEHQIVNVADTMKSLTEKMNQIAAAYETLQAVIVEIETNMTRLQSETKIDRLEIETRIGLIESEAKIARLEIETKHARLESERKG